MPVSPLSPPIDPPLAQAPLILGIESSCDDTAASLLRLYNPHGPADILASLVEGQDSLHAPFGGVVPEIAARAHAERLEGLITRALDAGQCRLSDIDAIAVTSGPGLIGGVIAGLMTAKGLAMALDKPLIGINHLEGHALSPLLAATCPFPYLLLLVSGGHCQILWVAGLGQYRRLGTTLDDAAGEAFDKTAKLLGLGFPGGPAIEALARHGNPQRFDFPRPLLDRTRTDPARFDLSFAGLKTAAARMIASLEPISQTDRCDVAASFQAAITDILVDRAHKALTLVRDEGWIAPDLSVCPDTQPRFVVAGGVAANQALRSRLQALADQMGFAFLAPPLAFCTDNAAMIALAGALRLAHGLAGDADDLSIPARPRWPLDLRAAQEQPVHRPGRKGAKA